MVYLNAYIPGRVLAMKPVYLCISRLCKSCRWRKLAATVQTNVHFTTCQFSQGVDSCLESSFITGYYQIQVISGTYDITADRDAFIEESSPGGNFGSDDRIKVNIADLDTYRSVVRFDVASLPAGKVVTDATLRLYVTDGSSDTMSVHRMTSAWTEGGVTWNTHASSYDPAAIVGFVPSVEEAFADIDLTATVDDWYRGITVNDGLMILTTGDDGFDFKARETGDPASRPRLLVTFADPVLALGRTATVLNDPIDGASNPHAVPGAVVRHEITVTNAGLGSPDDDTVVVLDDLSSHAALFAGDLGGGGSGPVSFTDGIPSSALTYTFTSLGSGTDDLDFSNDGGSSWTYVPTPDGDGYDTAVTHIRIRPQGTFAPESGGQSASFRIGYRVRVR